MKRILIGLFLILLSLPVKADLVLTGEASYNVNSAREAVLENMPLGVENNIVSKHIYDLENEKNLWNILNGKLELADRTLAYFSDGTYGILYKNDLYHTYYYKKDGALLYIDKKDGINYPYKAYKFDTFNKMMNMTLRVSKREAFIYNPKGGLIAHWVGKNGYDEKGNVIMTRSFRE